jgi:hypothetical protein
VVGQLTGMATGKLTTFCAIAIGGSNSLENYLAAHGICNMYRLNHLPEETQWILKIGVWVRRQMEGDSEVGRQMLRDFFKYEASRERRKKPRQGAPRALPSDALLAE